MVACKPKQQRSRLGLDSRIELLTSKASTSPSVAAPLRDAGHNVVAALSLAGPSDRMDDARRDIIHHVRRLAAAHQLQFDSR